MPQHWGVVAARAREVLGAAADLVLLLVLLLPHLKHQTRVLGMAAAAAAAGWPRPLVMGPPPQMQKKRREEEGEEGVGILPDLDLVVVVEVLPQVVLLLPLQLAANVSPLLLLPLLPLLVVVVAAAAAVLGRNAAARQPGPDRPSESRWRGG